MGVGSSKKLATSFAILATLLFALMSGVVAHAQVTGATVSGTVTDPSGGVVANATVTATNTATSITRDVTSDSAGLYTIPNLVPGPYDFKVAAAGFSTSVQSALNLAVGQQLQLNFSLKVGQTSTEVQVTGAAPQIDLTSSAVSGQVESETVRDLPLNGRDWTSLAVLQPGVKPIETQMAFATSARGNRGFGGELTVSGQRSTFNNYRIDGITVNDYAMAAPGNVIGVVLGVDSIQEFQVLTGGFPAEYGRATGGVVNAITRSGTNQFHGAVYEFLRNSALDSNDYFDRAAGSPRPPFKRNQFGASAGAPIIKDRLFVFADYEGLRQTKGIPASTTVFSPAVHSGFIVGNGPALNQPAGTPCTTIGRQIIGGVVSADPGTGGAPGQYVSPAANTCFANYAVAALPFWPMPNVAGSVNGDSGTFVFAGAQTAPENFGTIRVDYKIGNNDTLFGTFLRDPASYTQPDGFDDVGSVSSTSRTTIALEETHTFGSTFVNAARIGFNRDNVVNTSTPTAINPLASNNTTVDAIPGQTAPRFSVKGGITDFFGGTNSGSHYLHRWNSYQYYDDAIWTHGNHTVKFGGGAERMDYNEHTFQNPGGRYIFVGNPNIPGSIGGYQDFFDGLPSHLEGGLLNIIDEPREFRQTTFAAYVQDDWKFKPNLTFNIGIRYEPSTTLSDAQGRITNLATITATAPTCASAFSVSAPPYNLPAQPGTSCGSVSSNYYNNPTTKNFEPRIGFAWDPLKDGKTSVRGSFGIYDVDPFAGYFLLQQNQAGPFLIFKSVTGDPAITGANYVAGGGGAALATSTASKISESTIEASPHRTYVDEWGLSVQRQITSDMALTVGYVGTHGLHEIVRGDDGNMAGAPGSAFPYMTTPYGYLFANPHNVADTQVNPALGVIRYINWEASSNYNALDINVNKVFAHNFQFQVAYTFSKSLDDTSQTIAGDTFGNGINSPWWFLPQAFYGPSDFNVSHTLSINGLYTVPTPKTWSGAMKEALADWELGGIFTFNSGTPTTPINQGDPLNLQNGGADQFGPLVQLPGCNAVNTAGSAPGKPNWINASCFSEPYMPASFASSLPAAYACNQAADTGTANTPGNAPSGDVGCLNLAPFKVCRNCVGGPHFINLDFSIHKTFPIKERYNLQFRAEFFDILNNINFTPPQPNSGDSNSGIFNPNGSIASLGFISQYANPQEPAREIQFALKFQW
jgi:carboxypeptidase family protein/TonB-dependent receptor-like protein